ncbi:MAG TPA: plastocyanin/azurin family copper-binding protein [Solirubrobacteraceae bacterium]|nr:plastocyanin/azurin family copper-binding protein [Solirubrobacteraceae bacterium]
MSRLVLPGIVLALLPATVLPAVASEPSSTGAVMAENVPGGGFYNEEIHRWAPPQLTVKNGGVVTFSNPTPIPHGIYWVGAAPSCDSGVKEGTTEAASGPEWSGGCTFTKPGVYQYYCTVHGPKMSGTITVPGTPIAATEEPTSVTQTGATLSGALNPQGEATAYYFEYNATSGPVQRTATTSEGATDFTVHSVATTLKGLSPETTYHVKLVAAYGESHTATGVEKTFTTSAVAKPTVSTGSAASLTETGATLKGVLSAGGQVTSYRFEYGLTASYGALTPVQEATLEAVGQEALAPVTGLLPHTLYHFRLIAENASGPQDGEDRTFTTASTPPPSPPSPPSPTSTSPAPPTATTSTAPSPTGVLPGSLLTKAEEPLPGPAFTGSSLKLTIPRHGSNARGSIEVGQSGAGGRLEIDLLAKSALLGKGRGSKLVSVGRLVRQSLPAGRLSFSVALTGQGKRALAHRHSLSLTLRITLTPTRGATTSLTRSVVLRA